VFQIFQTLNARDDIESTGIGLSIVKKIIETYGGKIWIESELAKGSTFYFTIPVQENAPVGTC
jgi:two-component system, LuxR family, sensor kinase FixL